MSWGGARAGAGRKKTSLKVPHVARKQILEHKSPVEVSLRLRAEMPALTQAEIYAAFIRGASRARRHGLRIIEYAVYPRSYYLICEVKNSSELEKSFKSLNTTLAIAIKKAYQAEHKKTHKGVVFVDRYSLKPLLNETELRDSLRRIFVEKQLELTPEEPQLNLRSSAVLEERWLTLLDSREQRNYKSMSLAENDIKQVHKDAVLITASPQFPLSKRRWNT